MPWSSAASIVKILNVEPAWYPAIVAAAEQRIDGVRVVALQAQPPLHRVAVPAVVVGSSEYFRFTAIATIRPVPGSITTSPCAYRLRRRSLSSTCSMADDWIPGRWR